MTETNYSINGKTVSYEITEDGYDIYLGGRKWITQHEPHGKSILPNGTYEENALAQIEDLVNAENQESKESERLDALETSQLEQDELIAQILFGGDE